LQLFAIVEANMLTKTARLAARIRTACVSESARRGHTLIEMVLVTALVTGGSSIAYPQLSSLTEGYRVKNAGRRVMLELQKARFRAISEGKCVRVSFDAATKTYRIEKSKTATCSATSSFDQESSKQLDDGDTITVAAAGNPIFTPRGMSLTSSITTIRGRSSSISIKVDATGRVHAS
jgi:Tfp pilus assembly protein FimT